MAPTDRLTAEGGALLVVDLQIRLVAAVPGREGVVHQALRLARGAAILGVPVVATEQYPERLGPSVPGLSKFVADRPAKRTFHCLGAPGVLDGLKERGVRHVTLAGVETHVCVAQTALELLGRGFAVQVAVDAVGSRHPLDGEVALRRLERAGAVLTTVETALFEWAGTSERPEFKALSALIREADAPPRPSRPGTAEV